MRHTNCIFLSFQNLGTYCASGFIGNVVNRRQLEHRDFFSISKLHLPETFVAIVKHFSIFAYSDHYRQRTARITATPEPEIHTGPLITPRRIRNRLYRYYRRIIIRYHHRHLVHYLIIVVSTHHCVANRRRIILRIRVLFRAYCHGLCIFPIRWSKRQGRIIYCHIFARRQSHRHIFSWFRLENHGVRRVLTFVYRQRSRRYIHAPRVVVLYHNGDCVTRIMDLIVFVGSDGNGQCSVRLIDIIVCGWYCLGLC